MAKVSKGKGKSFTKSQSTIIDRSTERQRTGEIDKRKLKRGKEEDKMAQEERERQACVFMNIEK